MSSIVFSNIGKKYPEEWASTILAILALIICAPVYYFYRKGPEIRMRSKFAQQVAKDRQAQLERRKNSAGDVEHKEKVSGSDDGVRGEERDNTIEE